jgi:hypothetical protein
MSGNPLWSPAWEPDMSGSGALTRDKAERPDMFEQGSRHVQFHFWNPEQVPDKSGRDLAAEDLRAGPDMSGLGFRNSVRNPDKSGLAGNFGLDIDFDE